MAIDPVSAMLDIGGKVIDRLWPDPVQSAQAKFELIKLQQSGDLAQIAGQLEINKLKATNSNLFTSGWRPFVGWTCGAGFAVQFVIGPLGEWASNLADHPVKFPQMDLGIMMPLLFGMLGLGAYRTAEKMKGMAPIASRPLLRLCIPQSAQSKDKLLRNRIYLGELSHKGSWYPGAHPPIFDSALWEKVHSVLARDSHARSVETKIRSRTDALLRGLLYAPSGECMYPTYSRKNGRKYHYYVSKSESRFGAGKGYERLPAPEIEAAVVAQIRTVLTSPESIASVVRHIQRTGAQVDEATTVMAMGRLNDVWDQLFPVERHRIANLVIERIDLVHVGEVQGIRVKWRELGWDALIGEFAPREIGAELVEMEA